MTPKRFQDTEGVYFPFTVLDDRAGRETSRGMYEMIDEGKRASRLPAKVFAEVKAKAGEGERQMASGDLVGAFRIFATALNELPEPRQQWNASGWLLVAMGECRSGSSNGSRRLVPFKTRSFAPVASETRGCISDSGKFALNSGKSDRQPTSWLGHISAVAARYSRAKTRSISRWSRAC